MIFDKGRGQYYLIFATNPANNGGYPWARKEREDIEPFSVR